MTGFKTKLKKLASSRALSSGAMTALIIGLIIVVNVIVFVIGSYFGLYIFSPSSEDLSISDSSDELFENAKAIGKKVKIMFCQAKDEVAATKKGARVLNTAEQLAARHPDFIELEYVNIITKINNKNEIVDINKYQSETEDGVKIPIYKSSVIFECEDNFKVLTDLYTTEGYSDFYTLDSSGGIVAFCGEEMLSAMVMWVLNSEHKSAYFTTFHSESADIAFKNMLVASGYNVGTVDLRKNDVPADAELVIISNPQQDFEMAAENSSIRTEIERLRSYVLSGGNLYVSLDPYANRLPVLEAFIAEFGITVSSTEHGTRTLRNIVRDPSGATSADFFTLVTNISEEGIGASVSETVKKYSDSSVIVSNVAALSLDENSLAEPLLVTSSLAELYSGGEVVDSAGSYCVAAVSKIQNEAGDFGKIFVTPGIYLTSTDSLTSGGYANRDFVFSVMQNVFGKTQLPFGCKTVFYTTGILENLTMSGARIYTVCLMLIPAALACVGAVVLIKRKNR